MRYQIYEAKSVKYDAQQRVGMMHTSPETLDFTGFSGSFLPRGTRKVHGSVSLVPQMSRYKRIHLSYNLLIFVWI